MLPDPSWAVSLSPSAGALENVLIRTVLPGICEVMYDLVLSEVPFSFA